VYACIYVFVHSLDSRSSSKGKSAVFCWLIHVANDNSADDATTRVRRNDASRDAVVAPAVGHLINAAIFN